MGKVKEWSFTYKECVVCGKPFLPCETTHRIYDLKLPSCSTTCEREKKELFEKIAMAQTKGVANE